MDRAHFTLLEYIFNYYLHCGVFKIIESQLGLPYVLKGRKNLCCYLKN